MKYPFHESEITNARYMPDPWGGPDIVLFDTPISTKENWQRNMRGEALWLLTGNDLMYFMPECLPDNVARGGTVEARELPEERKGGLDMFGINWVYVPTVGGSMVQPGNPLMKDANEWKEKLRWPDIDSFPWVEAVEANREFLAAYEGYPVNVVVPNGWFERLISFMDFEGAVLAMVDEEQQDAIHELFDRISDMYIDIAAHVKKYFPMVTNITLHDDLGSQMAPFMSPAVVEEMLVPHHRKATDAIHAMGFNVDLHSCGQVTRLLPVILKMGYDRHEMMPLVDKDVFYDNYSAQGKFLTVTHDPFPENATDEDYDRLAKEYVDKYFQRGHASFIDNTYEPLPVPFVKALYRYSRQKAAEWDV